MAEVKNRSDCRAHHQGWMTDFSCESLLRQGAQVPFLEMSMFAPVDHENEGR